MREKPYTVSVRVTAEQYEAIKDAIGRPMPTNRDYGMSTQTCTSINQLLTHFMGSGLYELTRKYRNRIEAQNREQHKTMTNKELFTGLMNLHFRLEVTKKYDEANLVRQAASVILAQAKYEETQITSNGDPVATFWNNIVKIQRMDA